MEKALSLLKEPQARREDLLWASMELNRSPRRFRIPLPLRQEAYRLGLLLRRQNLSPTTREILEEFSFSSPLMGEREVLPHPRLTFIPSTASILPYGEDLFLVALKSVNYHMERGKYILHQKKVSHRCHILLMKKGELVSSQEMRDSYFQQGTSGLSDVRLLWTDGETFWGLGDTQSLFLEGASKNDIPRLCLLRGVLGQKKWLEVHPLSSSMEKNWLHLPIERLTGIGKSSPLPKIETLDRIPIEREFFLVKHLNPLTICRVVGDTLTEYEWWEEDPRVPQDLRGSAGFIPHEMDGEEGFLGVSHQVVFGKTRIYAHRFIFLKKDLSSLRCGHRFFFERVGVEFCLSLHKRDGEFFLSYSVEDRGPFLKRISQETLSSMFSDGE